MWLRLATALFFCAWHVYGISKALPALSSDYEDTAFLQRTLMVSTSMLFLMTLMAPDQSFRDALFFVNSYFVMYMVLLLSYITQSPYMMVIAVFACLFAISRSVVTAHCVTPRWRNYAPHAIAVYVTLVMYAYYSEDKMVDEFLDNTIRIDGIAPSRKPHNTMAQRPNVFSVEGFVPVFMGCVAFATLSLAYQHQKGDDKYLTYSQVGPQQWPKRQNPVGAYPVSQQYKQRF